MKWIQARRWLPTVVLLLALAGMVAWAEEFAIQSFDGTGRLTFNTISTAVVYVVESAATPTGKWTTTQASRAPVNKFSMAADEHTTCFYRLVAGVTNTFAPEPPGMVLIPGGTNAGTDPDFGAYSLTVSSFYMDKYEVTKAKWDEVYNWAVAHGYSFDNAGSGKAASHPVHSVSWYDCVKWCNARSEKEGRPAVYYRVSGAVYRTGQSDDVVQTMAAGYRLPTDVQWEYAARGGVPNRRFPWGGTDYIDHGRANYWSYWAVGVPYNSYDKAVTSGYHPTYATGGYPYTSPVGSFAANGYGLYDMAGNVLEWCNDWYPGYEGSQRVLRGGRWSSSAGNCRVVSRYGNLPDDRDNSRGFRAVLPLGQ